MFKILLNRKRLNDIANVARKHLSSIRHYRISEITQEVLSYDLLQAIQNDPVLDAYRSYIASPNYTKLYSAEDPNNILHIPDYFVTPLSYSGSDFFYIPSSINYPKCSYIGQFAFRSLANLQSVCFDACEIIGSRAFENCNGLVSISFPKCKRIHFGAFNNCKMIQNLNFPMCTIVEPLAFKYCEILRTVYMPKLNMIPYEMFQDMSYLTEGYFEKCTVVGSYAFDNCRQLSIMDLPNCLSIGKYAFRSCVKLHSLLLNKGQYIEEHAFENAINLSSIAIGSCHMICDYAFQNCPNLENITMLGDAVPKLNGSKIFENTPFALDYFGIRVGKMYVRESLFSKYVKIMSSIMNVEALAVYE